MVPVTRIVGSAFSFLIFAFWIFPAWAQTPPGAPVGQPQGLQFDGRFWGPVGPPQTGAMSPGGAGSSVIPRGAQGGTAFPGAMNPLPFAPSFPGALGNTVGGFPPGTVFPGYGNINQPGLAPGAPTVIPNINNPGGVPGQPPFGTPGLTGPGNPRPGWLYRHRNPAGMIFYGVPYAVPYYVYPYYPGMSGTVQSPGQPPSPEQPAEPPAPPQPNGPHSYQVLPEPAQPEQQPAANNLPGRTVTLLAFKDHTLVAVTDYWLTGDKVYYMRNDGTKTGIPLDQLYLILTQQLNRERNVPFVLEARP